jgi:hypothetical protein
VCFTQSARVLGHVSQPGGNFFSLNINVKS